MEDRLTRLRAKLGEQGLGGIFVSAPAEDTGKTLGANRRYLSGFSGSLGQLLITRDEAFVAVDCRNYEQAKRESPDFTLFQVTGPTTTWLPELLKQGRLGGKKLAFESHGLSYAAYQSLKEAVAGLPVAERPELVPTDGFVESLRVYKEPGELEALEAAVDLGDAAFLHAAGLLQ